MKLGLSNAAFTLVSDDDLERVKRHRWTVGSNGYIYCRRMINRKTITLLLHRFILCAPEGFDVHHINGIVNDNRRENLALCTTSQNLAAKRSVKTKHHDIPFRGVYRYTNYDKTVRAAIGVKGKVFHLGSFEDPRDAARAYDSAAVKHFGKFARTNASLNLI